MQKEDDLYQLFDAENHIKSYWAKISEYLQEKGSLVFIWEVKTYLEGIDEEIKRLRIIFARLQNDGEVNLEYYGEIISNLDLLEQHLNHIEGKNEWIRQMKEFLDQVVLNIEREREPLKTAYQEEVF